MRGADLGPEDPRPSDSLRVEADAAGVVAAAEWAEAWGRAAGFEDKSNFALRLCIEEAITNIVFYGYDPGDETRTVELRACDQGAEAVLEIRDRGRSFNIAEARDPGVEGDIQAATVGGRGIRLMRTFSDRLSYRRVDGENRLAFTFVRRPPAQGR